MAYNLQLSSHLSKEGTYKLLSQYYFWPKIIDLVKCFTNACYGYKHAKTFCIKYQGLLHPLPVPIRRWADIAIDFVTDLLPYKQHGYTYKNILIIIYQLIKEYYYIL